MKVFKYILAGILAIFAYAIADKKTDGKVSRKISEGFEKGGNFFSSLFKKANGEEKIEDNSSEAEQ